MPRKFRNLTIRVQLRLSDSEIASRTLPTLFAGSSNAVFLSQLMTGVSYHNSSPHFLDELKILLPYGMQCFIPLMFGFCASHISNCTCLPALPTDAHLFFTFLNLACAFYKADDVEKPVGFSLLKVYPNMQCVLLNSDLLCHVKSERLTFFKLLCRQTVGGQGVRVTHCHQNARDQIFNGILIEARSTLAIG